MHNRLLGSTMLFAPEGPAGGGAPAEPVVAPAAVEPAAPAPAADVPAVVPAVETPAAPAVETPKPAEGAEPAKPAEGAPDPAKAEPGAKPSLLSEAAKPDAKPAEAAKPADAPAEAVVEKPTYQPFTLPEGVKADDALMGQFTEMLGSNKLTQEQGQALIDLHSNAMKAQADHLVSQQWKAWNETNEKWVSDIKSDKEFGGAKFDTSTKAAKRMIDLLVKKDELETFNQFMDATGAGNHPMMFKLLNRVAQWLDEPVMPKPAAKPAKGNGRAPGPRGLRSMYKGAEQ